MTDLPVTGGPAGAGDTGVVRGLPVTATIPEGHVRMPDTGPPPAPPPDEPAGATSSRRGDRLFRWLVTGSGAFVVALIGAIGLFLLVQAIPSVLVDQDNFLLSRNFDTEDPANLRFGILDLLLVTVEVSVFALVLAMPVGLGIALFLTQYAPPRLARPFGYLIDVLAAVPSIIFGLWGILVLAPVLEPVAGWLQAHLGGFFLFAPGNSGIAGATVFTAGIVLAVMILPIITSITREVFERTPRTHVEAALALGATRWEVIRIAVLPFGRSGYISASMLGLGRALGETIALTIILAGVQTPFSGSLFDGGATFASKIALSFAELNNDLSAGAYIAAGLVLFVLTFAVNALARAVIARSGAVA
ncbi:phosphate ABC transporter membrane protein 1, PhoT family [Pseudonocardia thermophila]|jgi:phosphate ABC transporter, permease protein PstC|uniref:Phosphate transport system permease protein n=1 Tax=Pseudonocardia thermophila TaxID=1848 RepID=A0A1M6SAI3_PSETH|nr:phosphate ABC transporter permease subunit PstC [Pseudonocardia thermophila]SHK41783.1 phosphate ABC transporter membrane protein 1, PhoT family [Pseudonocardia thermophila]